MENDNEFDEDRREGKQQGIHQDLFIQGVKQHVYNNPTMAKKLNTMLTSWNNDMLIDRFDVRHLCDTPSMLKALIAVPSSSSSIDSITTKNDQYELIAADYYCDPDLVDELQFERYQDYVEEEEEEEDEEGKGVLKEPSQLLDSFSEWNQSGYVSNRKEIWTKSEAEAVVAAVEIASVNDSKQQLDNIDNSHSSSEEGETQRDFEIPAWYTKLISQSRNSINSSINQEVNSETDKYENRDDIVGNNISTTECITASSSASSTNTTSTATTVRPSISINWKIPHSRKQYQIILHTAKTIRDRDKKFNRTGSSTSTDNSKNTAAASDATIVANNDSLSSSAQSASDLSMQSSSSSSFSSSTTRAPSSSPSVAGTQLEILLKVKQADNPLFAFLMSPTHCYHAFYRYLKEEIDESAFWEIFMEKEIMTNNTTSTDSTAAVSADKNTTEVAAVIVKNNNDSNSNSNKPNALSLLGSMYDDDDDDDEEEEEDTVNDMQPVTDTTIISTDTIALMATDSSHTLIPSSTSTNTAVATNNSGVTDGDDTTTIINTDKKVEEGECSSDTDIEDERDVVNGNDKTSKNGGVVYDISIIPSNDSNNSSITSIVTTISSSSSSAAVSAVTLKQAERREKAKLLLAQQHLLKQTVSGVAAVQVTDGEDEEEWSQDCTTTAATSVTDVKSFPSTNGCNMNIEENTDSSCNSSINKNEVQSTTAAVVEETIALQRPLQQSQSQEQQMSKKTTTNKRRRWDVIIATAVTPDPNINARVTKDSAVIVDNGDSNNKRLTGSLNDTSNSSTSTSESKYNIEDVVAVSASDNSERSVDTTVPQLLSSDTSDQQQQQQLQQSSASALAPPPSSESALVPVITKSKRKRSSRWDT